MYTIDEVTRIETAKKCKDCKYLPKVKGAGKIFTENNVKYQIMFNGVKVLKDCYVGEWVTELIKQMKGIHEPQEEKVFFEVLKSMPDNAIMIELGSYWAYYSIWFNKSVKNATNFLIEPMQENLEQGRKNFELNNIQGHFTNAFMGKTYNPHAVFDNWDGRKIPMEQISIDYFVEKHNIPFINILHSDIQEAECDMLLGCEQTIKDKKIGYFFISTHSNNIHDKCIQFLKENDFIIVAEHNLTESYSLDGLIVAKSKYINGPEQVSITKRKRTFWEKNCKLIDKIKYKLKYGV